MNKSIKYAAIAALPLLASCSSEETVSMKQDGIRYNVTAMNQTRAADSYCNTDKPASFKVWALTVGDPVQTYIDGDLIVKEGSVYNDQAGVRYWPQDKNLDFYAEVNGDENFDLNGGNPVFNNFQVNPSVNLQRDLMYAVAKNLGRNTSQNSVSLNFRHALSQVCFMVRNDASNLSVRVKGVTAGHLSSLGNYTFPSASTSENYEHPEHGDGVDPDAPVLNGGTWDILDAPSNKYEVSGLDVKVGPKSEVANLTAPGNGHENGFLNVMTLMPQSVAAWDPAQKGADYNGAYFMLDVDIYNVVGDSESLVHSGKCVIPVNVNWEQGYRYIYTLIFDEGGNGGWTDTPENPQPVLAGVKYDVQVDDFIPVDGEGIMNGNGQDPVAKFNEWNITRMDGDNQLGVTTVKSRDDEYEYNLSGLAKPADKEDKQFAGWSLSKGGDPVTSITLVKGTEAPAVYALWKDYEAVTYRIHFDKNIDQTVYYFPEEDLVFTTTARSHTFELPQGLDADGKDWIHPQTNDWYNYGWKYDRNGDKADIPYSNLVYTPGTLTLTADKPEVTLYVHWDTGTPAGGTGTIK